MADERDTSSARCRSPTGPTRAWSPMTPRTRPRRSRRSSRCDRPKGAPNVLIVLIDDVGFGASSAFGGRAPPRPPSVSPPDGLKYNRFHDRALLADPPGAPPGRNHHSVGWAEITEIATSAPGYNSVRPNLRTARGDAQTERLFDGPVRQVPRGARLGDEPLGPFNAWPTGSASSTSTASSAARRTSTHRRSTATPCRSSSRRRPRRATTSPRT